LIINLSNANEETNVVKTSELELFLFKVGFESLLKDVEATKDKSKLNEDNLKTLNEKVELIMNEIYKDKRVLKTDSNQVVVNTQIDKSELIALKEEIELLKQEIRELKNNKKEEIKKEVEVKKSNIYTIKVEIANLRDRPITSGNIIENLNRGQQVEVEYCDKFDWCKINGEEKYISKYLLEL
jgi:DNA repair exonuclease SbcCD ATPase subunit